MLLPGDPEVRLTSTIGDRVAGDFLQQFKWPWLTAPSGKAVDYSVIASASQNANDKVYANASSEGWCALHDGHTGDFVAFGYPPEKLPFVGVCLNHGGWPFDGARGYWAALEPCTSFPDNLDQAIALDKHATLAPHSAVEWLLTLHVGQAQSAEAVRQQVRSKYSALASD